MGADGTTTLLPTERTTLRRKRERGRFDREFVNHVLDEGLVCHVGFATDRGPVVLPMAYARIDDRLYLHGAARNEMLRHLARGTEVCVTVTLVDGIVFARSAFHHSMNYRSVVLFGSAERVTEPDEMRAATTALLDHLAAGRSGDARQPTDDELRATLMVRLAISEGSAKVRTGGPIDDADDLESAVWAGELPLVTVAGEPVTDHPGDGRPPLTPDYLTGHRLRA